MTAVGSGIVADSLLGQTQIDVGGLNTAVWQAGEGHPIVCVHGGGPGADGIGNWSTAAPRLVAGGCRVIAPDMIGFGASAKPDPSDFAYTNDARAQHLGGMLDALEIDRAVFVGNSMGGAASLRLALDRPDRIAGLVLVGSAGLTPTAGTSGLKAIGRYEPTIEAMETVVSALTADNFLVDPRIIEHRHEVMQTPGALEAYREAMQRWSTPERFRFDPEELRRISAPTLVVGGADDKAVPYDLAVQFFELIPGASLHIISGCGHWPMVERPDAFAGVVLEWLRSTQPLEAS